MMLVYSNADLSDDELRAENEFPPFYPACNAQSLIAELSRQGRHQLANRFDTCLKNRHPNLRGSDGDCLKIGGIRPQLLLAAGDHWPAGISLRSRSRACHCRRHSALAAAGRPLVATSASAATCSSGGSPGSWLCLR